MRRRTCDFRFLYDGVIKKLNMKAAVEAIEKRSKIQYKTKKLSLMIKIRTNLLKAQKSQQLHHMHQPRNESIIRKFRFKACASPSRLAGRQWWCAAVRP